ncbi:MAG: hypothetical protein AAGI07_12070 [Bacteroidota bacterium]
MKNLFFMNFSCIAKRSFNLIEKHASTHFMKNLVLIYLSIFCLILSGCDDDDDNGGSQGIVLTLLESDSQAPANVSLFFKADFDNGDAVADLEISDISIFEDNELISEFEATRSFRDEDEEFLFSNILLLDLSGSVLDAEALPILKEASIDFIEQVIQPDSIEPIEMAIYWFDGEQDIHLLEGFTSDRTVLINSINSITSDISSDNSTNLNGAVSQGIRIMEQRLDAIEASLDVLAAGSILIFTDGTDRANRVTESAALDSVRRADENISMFTIGLGGEIDQNVLNQFGKDGFELADNPDGLTESFEEAARNIRDEANSFYIFEYCSPKRSGTFSLKIEVSAAGKSGTLEVPFDANGFTGGCTLGN